jgi:hypothetical protein
VGVDTRVAGATWSAQGRRPRTRGGGGAHDQRRCLLWLASGLWVAKVRRRAPTVPVPNKLSTAPSKTWTASQVWASVCATLRAPLPAFGLAYIYCRRCMCLPTRSTAACVLDRSLQLTPVPSCVPLRAAGAAVPRYDARRRRRAR